MCRSWVKIRLMTFFENQGNDIFFEGAKIFEGGWE